MLLFSMVAKLGEGEEGGIFLLQFEHLLSILNKPT